MLLIVNLVLDFRFWIKSQTHGLDSLKKLLLYYSLLLLNQQILFCTLKFLHVIMAHRQFFAEWVLLKVIVWGMCSWKSILSFIWIETIWVLPLNWCECNLISHYKEEALLLTEEFVEQLFFFWDHWVTHFFALSKFNFYV